MNTLQNIIKRFLFKKRHMSDKIFTKDNYIGKYKIDWSVHNPNKIDCKKTEIYYWEQQVGLYRWRFINDKPWSSNS